MQKDCPPRFAIWIQVVCLVAVAGVAVWQAPNGNWDWQLIGILFGFALVSEFMAVRLRSGIMLSGSFIGLVLAMVLLGGTPAAVIGVATMFACWLRERTPTHYLVENLLNYAMFPLAGGIAFREVQSATVLAPSDAAFYVAIFGVFVGALALNTVTTAGQAALDGGWSQFWSATRGMIVTVLPSDLGAAMLTMGVAYIYFNVGVAGIALFGVVLVTFQHLIAQLVLSLQRAGDLESRTKQLVSFQVGVLGALMKTLDLRDEMTARHCASVARYSRAIAKAAGMSQKDQELVHIAGLMHDIGKFILPDHILKANVPLTDDDWNLIRMHPQQGANVVSALEGYGPVAEIVLAHHERIDGKGYPRGLKGDDIPEMSRIISVADTYDVMTARDSYKEPVSSFEAIQELQRVAGSQLDERFVRIFVEEVLEGKDLTYRHGEDADFDVELALEERIAAVEEQTGRRLLVGGARVG
jgi:putative nucleotidyltransferase with HDIG domain